MKITLLTIHIVFKMISFKDYLTIIDFISLRKENHEYLLQYE